MPNRSHSLSVVLSIASELLRKEKELKAIEKAIEQTVQVINPLEYQVLKSIPGIGPTYAAGILAEIGVIKAFPNNDALAKYCDIIRKEN